MAGLSIGGVVGMAKSAISSADADLQAKVTSGDTSPLGLVGVQEALTNYTTVIGLTSALAGAFDTMQKGILQKM